ncbi:SRPBCC family protein [soil metagenome]
MNDNLIATATVRVAASPEDVWQALTDPVLIERYFFGTTAESDWHPGSPITWSGEYDGKEYLDHGTILEAVPRERLVHTHFSPLTGREDVPENYHTLTWSLTPEAEGTILTLTQDNNHSYDEVEHSEKNWHEVLEGLKSVVES